jgi:hypothetical protein
MTQLSLLPETADPPLLAQPKRESAAPIVDRHLAQILATCAAKGIDPKTLLLEIKFREV